MILEALIDGRYVKCKAKNRYYLPASLFITLYSNDPNTSTYLAKFFNDYII